MTLLASLRDWLKAQQLDAVLLSSRRTNSRIWGSPPDQVMW